MEGELLPWGLAGVDLGDDVLEIGPGFGATTRVLARKLPKLTALELDEGYCKRLETELRGAVTVVQGDATRLPFPDDRFSGAICFTMLHHIPSAEQQDRVFSEVARVLRPGGVFAGTDSVGTGAFFRLIHVGDIRVTIDPGGLPARLEAAGLVAPEVRRSNRSFRFLARTPA